MQNHSAPNRFQHFRARRKVQGMKELRRGCRIPLNLGFAAEVKHQVVLLRMAPEEREALEFIETAADWDA